MTRRLDHLPPATPLDYAAAAPRRRRPKIVGFIGWVCAGLGYASFIMKGSQLPSYFIPDKLKWMNPDWKPPQLSRGDFTIAVSFLLIEMLVGLVCMSAGIGCLKMREWGRRLAIVYAVVSIVLTILKCVWQVHMFDFMLDYQQSMTTQPFDRELAGNREFFALISMSVMSLFWPLIVISILTRRHIKDIFANLEGADDSQAADWGSSPT